MHIPDDALEWARGALTPRSHASGVNEDHALALRMQREEERTLPRGGGGASAGASAGTAARAGVEEPSTTGGASGSAAAPGGAVRRLRMPTDVQSQPRSVIVRAGSATWSSAGGAAVVANAGAVANMMAMGFELAACEAALASAEGDEVAAISLLLTASAD